MRKILFFALVGLFICGLAFADSDFTYENVTILGPSMGGSGKTPPIEVIRVTIGSEDDTVSTGMVMAWGIESNWTDGNALGLVVNICDRSVSEDIASTAGKGPYAGVMVTTCNSQDVAFPDIGGWNGNANPVNQSFSAGFMAIRGFVDAYVDTSEGTLGGHLVIHGNAQNADGGSPGYFATLESIHDNSETAGSSILSTDIGFLLEKKAADGLTKVWLR